MKVVIDIDKDYYEIIKHDVKVCHNNYFEPYNIIANGIPLPKGHGDLIDREELLKQPMDFANYPSNYVKMAQTIIKADD